MKERLLFIGSDSASRTQLCSYLQARGFEVLTALDGREAPRQVYMERPDLVILDHNLSDLDPVDLCMRLRELCDVPIVMLSSSRAAEDVVLGLEAGADDYVPRPFEPRELEARVRAVLRRVRAAERHVAPGYDDGHLRIDLERQTVWRRGSRVHLSPTEFRLLTTLLQRNGNVVPHEELLAEVWGSPCMDSLNYVSLYIRYIREKLEDDPKHPIYIQTKWGVGYRFVPQTAGIR